MVVLMLLSSAAGVAAQHPEWMVYTTENSKLPSNEVIELAVDPRGGLWIGMQGGGLAKVDRETWMIYSTDNSGLSSNTVPALAFDTQGQLWVGTGDGLARFDGKTWFVYTPKNSDLPYHAIHALAIDAQAMLWIGTGRFDELGGGGLAKPDRMFLNWTVYTTDHSDLPGNQILALAVDSQENIWVGTQGNNGVAVFDGATWTVYTPDNSDLPAGDVPAIVCDAQGTTWIGTEGGGVARFDGATWTVYTTQNSGLPHNNVQALALDAQGILWVGTEQGLVKFDGAAWTAYTPENSSLPHGWVWELAPDIQGNLWIGTKGGLAVYREGGILFPEKATREEDLVGIWEGWHAENVVYMQFEADGSLKTATKVERLRDPSLLKYSGRFWFEGGGLKFTDSLGEARGRGPGTYEVWVRKRDGKAVHLSLHVIEDPTLGRARDLTRGMRRVEP